MINEKKIDIEKPWFRSYKLGKYQLKRTMKPYPKINLYELLDTSVKKYPNKPVLSYQNKKISYNDLKFYVDRLAAGFKEKKKKKGDIITTILSSSFVSLFRSPRSDFW